MRKTIITVIAVALSMAFTACRFNFDPDSIGIDYADEAAVRAEMARMGYDAALTVTVDDTQRVVYMHFGNDTVYFNESYCGKDSAGKSNSHSWYLYLTMSDIADDGAVTLTPMGDSTFSVDSSATILLAKPVQGKEAELHRLAAWGLYGFREPMEAALKESREAFEESDEALDEAVQDLDEAAGTLLEFDTTIIAPGCKAQKSFEKLEKKGKELHFTSFEIRHKPGHQGCTFSCSHGIPGAKRCYSRMEQISKLAGDEGLAYSIHHHGLGHMECTFTCTFR